MIDYYSILEVSDGASHAEIKAAFKRLAVKYHPDKHSGDTNMEELFKEVNQAYQVLSNPYEKARYDLQRQFGSQGQSHSYQPPPPPYARRPVYHEPQINWKENWRATAYAFGFTVIVASVVMSVIFVKNYMDEQNFQEKIQERRAEFESAQTDYQQGRVVEAMMTLEKLGVFLKQEEDMERYKTNLLENFLFEAEYNYNQKNYRQAVFYYELLESFAPRNPLQLKEHLASSYLKLDQPKKAVYYIKQLLVNKYREMEMFLLLAQVYRDQFQDFPESLRYFELASEVAIKRYRALYGDAYPLFIKGVNLEPEHYYLYTGLAEIYYKTERYDRALKAIKWNMAMWPDSTSNYITAAKSHLKLKEPSNACDLLKEAQALGYAGDFRLSCP